MKPAFESTTTDDAPRKSSSWLWMLLAIAAIAGFIVLLANRRNVPEGDQHPGIGRPLKILQLEPLTGDSQPLQLDDVRGKVVLINYWGTWCPPCREEFPHLVELEKRLRSYNDFQFVSVSCGHGWDEEIDPLRADTATYLNRQQAEFSTYADPHAHSRMGLLESVGGRDFLYPTTVLIDRQGVIRGLWFGYHDGIDTEMRALSEKLLRE